MIMMICGGDETDKANGMQVLYTVRGLAIHTGVIQHQTWTQKFMDS